MTDAANTLKLWCVVRRDRSVFSLDVPPSTTIAELKNVIYREMRFDVRGESFAPKEMMLYHGLKNDREWMTDEHATLLWLERVDLWEFFVPMASSVKVARFFRKQYHPQCNCLYAVVELPPCPRVPLPPRRQEHIVTINVDEHTTLLPEKKKKATAIPAPGDTAAVVPVSHSQCVVS